MLKIILLTLVSLTLSAQQPILPIPQNITFDNDEATLGKELFSYPLSKESKLSCASCHDITKGGADSLQYSLGADGKEGLVNTPTIYNSSFNFVQNFNGQAKDLKEQLVGHIVNPHHMDTTLDEIVMKLSKTDYANVFARVYEDGLTKENFLSAMVEFEKALITPNSKFDRYLRGDISALNKQEKRGYEEFQTLGCIYCHNGVNIGSNMYQKMGLFSPYKQDKILNGRIDVSKRDRDKFVYKVPTLRNIALTAPYMHDGSVKTLQSAVLVMREHQLGLKGEYKNMDDLVAFLKTFSGEKPMILKGEK